MAQAWLKVLRLKLLNSFLTWKLVNATYSKKNNGKHDAFRVANGEERLQAIRDLVSWVRRRRH